MNFKGNRTWIAGLAALVAAAVCFQPAVRAQALPQPGSDQSGSGQPARAVRLSYVDGQVKIAQGNQILAQQAVANAPLFEGMQLTTADSGKAEIQFEDGSVARLSPDSSLTLSVLRGAGTTADAELTVNTGLAYFEMQGGGQAGQMSVHFGSSTVTTSGFTVLRVTMDNPPGNLAVFSGNAHLEGNNGNLSVDLHGGESIALNGADPSQYDLAESIEPNSWDSFNSDRDQALTTEAAAQTGASANLGESQNPAWNDLDANGSWYDVPGQGEVWSPYDAANTAFDPYGNGNWMYTPGYGYIWASGYPWGYLPFQCGAWNFYDGFGWGWAPGMGGCMPWWGMGFYGGPNIGYAPVGYRPISRPGLPHRLSGRTYAVVSVNRQMAVASGALPARNGSTPVTIAGNTVQALRPLPSRPVYTQAGFTAGANRTSLGAQTAGTRPAYVSNRPAGRPAAPAYQSPSPNRSYAPTRSAPPPASHSSSGGGSYSAPRPSSSGGGGSYHPSGGGGGGGGAGGASHSNGGHR